MLPSEKRSSSSTIFQQTRHFKYHNIVEINCLLVGFALSRLIVLPNSLYNSSVLPCSNVDSIALRILLSTFLYVVLFLI